MTQLCYTVYGPDAEPNGFEALASVWNKLLQRTQFNSFFLTHEWQTTWWEYLGQGELWILAFHQLDEDVELPRDYASPRHLTDLDKVIGILPLYRYQRHPDRAVDSRQQVLTLIGCTEVSDYLDAIVVNGWEEVVYQSFFEWLQSKDAPSWDQLDLCNLPEESHTYQLLPHLFDEGSFRVNVLQEDVAPQFDIPEHYDTYLLEKLDKKQRHEIRRKQRRAEREAQCEFIMVGLDLARKPIAPQQEETASAYLPSIQANESNVTLSSSEIDHAMDDFLRLQMASRDDKAEFMTDEMATFFRGMAHKIMACGHLRLSFLKLDGITAACLLAFEYNGRYWLYNSGYDPTVFAPLSPGWVLLAYTIQYAVVAGLKVYDFMQGDEEYKYRFGSQDYRVMRMIVERI
ncbi:MAG: GNAT family N-acetyltransferase [Chloroflexota bacterium]